MEINKIGTLPRRQICVVCPNANYEKGGEFLKLVKWDGEPQIIGKIGRIGFDHLAIGKIIGKKGRIIDLLVCISNRIEPGALNIISKNSAGRISRIVVMPCISIEKGKTKKFKENDIVFADSLALHKNSALAWRYFKYHLLGKYCQDPENALEQIKKEMNSIAGNFFGMPPDEKIRAILKAMDAIPGFFHSTVHLLFARATQISQGLICPVSNILIDNFAAGAALQAKLGAITNEIAINVGYLGAVVGTYDEFRGDHVTNYLDMLIGKNDMMVEAVKIAFQKAVDAMLLVHQ